MEINPNFSDKANTDYYLVKAAVNGDQKAYAELLDRYKDAIYYLILKMVNNSVDAEDLTIEAFSKAFKNIDQYSPKYAFSTWLFKIATNNCVDFMRKKRCQTVSMDNQDSENENVTTYNFKTSEPNPEEHIIKNQKNENLRELVKKLKPRYRTLIELRFFEEYSYDEIAKELDMPLGTVKAQLFRAKEFLLNIIKKSNQI
jgi:RNA polymerase sigma-70 factor (ECF subfamily)